MIRKSVPSDVDMIYEIINDASRVYKGIIPEDRWHEPYMPKEELQHEIEDGVVFWVFEAEGEPAGVMGIQDKGEVCLIRHSYVRTFLQKGGIGTGLLKYLESKTDKPVLIGTWTDAVWAISFYEKNGYCLLPREEKNRLLRTYWTIPERQVETSVVLADEKWMNAGHSAGHVRKPIP
jgi:N-acetylglutamate synthase-like GNAT family acetyltransferase